MAKKAKELCKWKKNEVSKNFGQFEDIVKNPKYVCKSCGWVATQKKWLHKPTSIK